MPAPTPSCRSASRGTLDELPLTIGRPQRTPEEEKKLMEAQRKQRAERIAYGRNDAAAPQSGRKSCHAAGDDEHRSVAARGALPVQPAMRHGALPGWNVPGRCARSDAKPPVWRPVQVEPPMREWPLRGSSERQALSLKALRSTRVMPVGADELGRPEHVGRHVELEDVASTPEIDLQLARDPDLATRAGLAEVDGRPGTTAGRAAGREAHCA